MKSKWKTKQQVEWSRFADLMLSDDKAKAANIFGSMTDAGNIENARRWLFGANANQKRESAARQRACSDEKAVSREVEFMVRDKGFLGNDAL